MEVKGQYIIYVTKLWGLYKGLCIESMRRITRVEVQMNYLAVIQNLQHGNNVRVMDYEENQRGNTVRLGAEDHICVSRS